MYPWGIINLAAGCVNQSILCRDSASEPGTTYVYSGEVLLSAGLAEPRTRLNGYAWNLHSVETDEWHPFGPSEPRPEPRAQSLIRRELGPSD